MPDSGLAPVLGGRCTPRTIGVLLSRGRELDLYIGPGQWVPIDYVTARLEGQHHVVGTVYVVCRDGHAYRASTHDAVACRIVQKGRTE